MSRSHKHSCGCAMCKPWKYGFEPKFKFSELKQLAKSIEEGIAQMKDEELWYGECTPQNPCDLCRDLEAGRYE